MAGRREPASSEDPVRPHEEDGQTSGTPEPSERPVRRRARGLPGTLGVTFLGAVVPGAGYLWTRRFRLGLVVMAVLVLLVVAAGWYVGRDLQAATRFLFSSGNLEVAAGVMAAALALWFLVVVSTYLLVRPHDRTRSQSVVGGAFVVVLCLTLASPVVVGIRYARVQATLVESVFEDNQTATAPKIVIERQDPWGGRERINVLLLGGDGNVRREGVRTDSIVVASIETRTGRTVLFSLPRNMTQARFPGDSPLHELYPHGFTGPGDPANYMLNAVYGQVPELHPGILGESDNEGADALKQAVAGTLGIDVDYYVLVNLLGFRKLVDAMGGVTVNINTRVPIGGNTDRGIPPDDYLEPGPQQRLNGFEALWYSRGRYGSDDYARMERQRCMIDAIIEEARPWTVLRRYERLADAGKELVRTDIPSALTPAFVELALKVKDAPVRSVVFRRSRRFAPDDPNFRWVRKVVRRALTPPTEGDSSSDDGTTSAPPAGNGPGSPSPGKSGHAVDPEDACAYHGDVSTASG